VRAALIGHEEAGVDQQCWYLRLPFAKQFYVADTPCQSPEAGRFSATGVEISARVAGKVHNECCSVVNANPFLERHIKARDLKQTSRLVLRTDDRLYKCQGRNRSYHQNRKDLQPFDHQFTLHQFQSI
jgi:hypothetical protein